MHRRRDEHGFTLLEILMVILLVAILAAVGITAFINFSPDAKNSATKSNLQIIRNGIGAQFGNLTLHCGDQSGTWPAVTTLNANNIAGPNVDGGVTGSCTTADVASASNVRFVGGTNAIPVNPWGLGITIAAGGAGNNVYDCTAATGVPATNKGANTLVGNVWVTTVGGPTNACNPTNSMDCGVAGGNVLYSGEVTTGGAVAAAKADGWCYDPTSGNFWANSANNGGGAGATENTF